jgi:hypothetical protein
VAATQKPPSVSEKSNIITGPVKGNISDSPSVKQSEEKAVPKKLVNPFEQ